MTDQVLTEFAEGIWLTTAPVKILGMPLSTTMTVLRLGDGSVLLHSPIPMTDECRAAVEALGPVKHLYAPNTHHHLWVNDWAEAFDSAQVHAPSALTKKRPDVRIDRAHGAALGSTLADVIDEVCIEGFLLNESVLVYRPARTLVVADLVHNIGQPTHGWTKFYTRMMGFYDRVALSRIIRWTAFNDRAAARRSLDAVLEHAFDRIIVGHGTPIVTDARQTLATAYEWLPASG
ncbi:MAG: DUF4336 domain-containing protein [Myxococcota bacterium]